MRHLGLLAVLAVVGCKKQDVATKSVPFSDDFERNELGTDWFVSGGQWTIDKGQVFTTGANNAPLFLKVALPKDVVVEVDVTSETPIVDSKIELMTNGRAHASGYVFILGGWSNAISCIARLDEHGADRKEKKPTGIPGAGTHRWRVEKKGGHLDWYVDGRLYMSFDDPEPLDGPGQDRLAFSNWQNRVRYDNLKIWPLDQAPPIKTSTTGP